MFQKQEVVLFEGLNSSVAPELIKDGEARDIYNFRMEKIGKLVSRNGYSIGLYSELCSEMLERRNPFLSFTVCTHAPILAETPRRRLAYIECQGIIGMGEYVLEDFWVPGDTDRMMVYYIRTSEANTDYAPLDKINDDFTGLFNFKSANTYKNETNPVRDQKRRSMFLLSPMSGVYKNKILLGGELGALNLIEWQVLSSVPIQSVSDKMVATPKGTGMTVPIFAPNKELDINDDWIKQYADINQYRNKLIISDYINGDMAIEDVFSTEFDNKETIDSIGTILKLRPPHDFSLRPNTLESFDVNIVEIDLRNGTNEENDSDVGVKNGMALYQYKLPKKRQKTTRDNFEDRLTSAEYLGLTALEDGTSLSDEQRRSRLRTAYSKAVYTFRNSNTKFKYLGGIGKIADTFMLTLQMAVNHLEMSDERAVYTNADTNEEFLDVFGDLELPTEDYYDEKGVFVKDVAANVYLWNDMELQYFPTSGSILGNNLMSESDRIFTKESSGTPRIIEIEDVDDIASSVPLGSWRYRFVWDFGDGVYSAPSAEMLMPDRIWSAVKDEWLTEANYRRPSLYSNDPVKTLTQNSFPYTDYAGLYRAPSLFVDNTSVLTELGQLFYNVKNKIYESSECKYGIDTSSVSSWDEIKRGEFATLITSNFGKSDLPLKGIIYEGSLFGIINNGSNYSIKPYPDEPELLFEPLKLFALYHDSYYNMNDIYFEPCLSKLVVPIFKSDSREYTFNSVFDDEGRYRIAWSRVYNNVNQPLQYQIVFPGVHPNIPSTDVFPQFDLDGATGVWTGNYSTSYFVNTLHNKDSQFFETNDLYLNIICDDETGFQDIQNATERDFVGGGLYNQQRPNTIFRAVKEDKDRLINITESDFEAVNRLILSNAMAELKIIDEYDEFGVTSQYQVYMPNSEKGYENIPLVDVDNTQGLGFLSQRVIRGIRSFVGVIQKKFAHNLSDADTGGLLYVSKDRDRVFDSNDFIAENNFTAPSSYFTNGDAEDLSDPTIADKYKNVEVYIYGEAERNITLEQLTSYFPSSLLYESPRVALKIPNDRIPRGAKKLLVYRTKNINANDYDPHVFGLVEEVDIERVTLNQIDDVNLPGNNTNYNVGDACTKITRDGIEVSDYKGVYFFDDVKDTALDFSNDISRFEGLRDALHSRFNVAINENVYFANYLEQYNPMIPRKQREEEVSYIDYTTVWNTDGYDPGTLVDYKFCYIDVAGVRSPEQNFSITVVPPADPPPAPGAKVAIILYMLPSTYDASIEKLLIYRKESPSKVFFLLGEIDKTSVGIFVDKNKPKYETFVTWHPNIQKYATGVRWSERYRADWIKSENMAEYGSGDGSQITGLLSNYGNLLIFKERAIFRVAVQAANPPISRTDEAVPDVGCIAPNTLISVDNTAYFLSWKGWMKYDNNVPQKIDLKFDEELQYYIAMLGEKVRDATSGYNASTNEIYLNLPQLPMKRTLLYGELIDTNTDGLGGGGDAFYTMINNLSGSQPVYNIDYDNVYKIYEREDWFYSLRRRMMGNIYVINLTTGVATKYGYQPTIVAQQNTQTTLLKLDTFAENGVRMYFNNTLGEMRSADIMPSIYGDTLSHAGMYIETPYYSDINKFKDTDEIIDGYYYTNKAPTSLYPGELFPRTYDYPIRSAFKSKMFTGNDETQIKRIRKSLFNIYSKGYIRIESYYNNYDSGDSRIEVDNQLMPGKYASNEPRSGKTAYMFNPTVRRDTGVYAENLLAPQVEGRYTNIIQIIPQSQFDDDELQPFSKIFDLDGKPVKYGLELYTEYRTQLNEISFYWRPIHGYLS
jgi:hypothetical protein